MENLAEELDMKVAEISDYPDWRQENDRLTVAGEAILSDMETHGPHLDNILIGETRMKWALLNMSRAIRRDAEAISEEAIAAEKLLAQPETPEEREQWAELEALKFPPASVGCGQCSHTRGARGGAKGFRRLCGAPLRKVRYARRRGAREPLNIQELEHPPVTAARLPHSRPITDQAMLA